MPQCGTQQATSVAVATAGHSEQARERMQCPAPESLGDLADPPAVAGCRPHRRAKKTRKQRIPGGRRTLAASGGDWFTQCAFDTESFRPHSPHRDSEKNIRKRRSGQDDPPDCRRPAPTCKSIKRLTLDQFGSFCRKSIQKNPVKNP